MLEHGFQAGLLPRRTAFHEMGFGLNYPVSAPGIVQLHLELHGNLILSEIHEGGIPFPPNPIHRAAINCSSTQKNLQETPLQDCNQTVQSIFTPRGQFCVAQCLLPTSSNSPDIPGNDLLVVSQRWNPGILPQVTITANGSLCLGISPSEQTGQEPLQHFKRRVHSWVKVL